VMRRGATDDEDRPVLERSAKHVVFVRCVDGHHMLCRLWGEGTDARRIPRCVRGGLSGAGFESHGGSRVARSRSHGGFITGSQTHGKCNAARTVPTGSRSRAPGGTSLVPLPAGARSNTGPAGLIGCTAASSRAPLCITVSLVPLPSDPATSAAATALEERAESRVYERRPVRRRVLRPGALRPVLEWGPRVRAEM
jgi:hypothetical protein